MGLCRAGRRRERQMRHRVALACSLPMILVLASCSPKPETDGPLKVCAGIRPVAHLVRRVGGEHVDVQVLVQPE